MPTPSELIRQSGVNAKKALGQNFLNDSNVIHKIVQLAGDVSGAHIIEVGPGPGTLTQALLATAAADVTAVEKDPRFATHLATLTGASAGRLRVIEADALATDLTALTPAPRCIIANLPYNIATPLLVQWLGRIYTEPQAFRVLVLMFQKEVAERLTAAPGCKAYGRLSVLTQWLCAIERSFDVPPGCFTPPPKITSTVIRLTPRPAPLYPAEMDGLQRLLAAAFGQRRKMLRSALKSLVPNPESLLAAAFIDPTRRAETLTVEEFCTLAGKL